MVGDPWGNKVDPIWILLLVAVTISLPVLAGWRHGSIKVGVVTAVLKISVTPLTLAAILWLDGGWGGPYYWSHAIEVPDAGTN